MNQGGQERGGKKKERRVGKRRGVVQIRLGQDSRTGVGRERKGEGTGKEKSKKAKEVRTGQ